MNKRELAKLEQANKPKKPRQNSIDIINKKAREAGLSYGKYKALEYIKNNNI